MRYDISETEYLPACPPVPVVDVRFKSNSREKCKIHFGVPII